MNTPTPSIQELKSCFYLGPREGKHIDPVKLLQYLERYANILAEHIATPGLDAVKTELVRGQRLHCLVLAKSIKEEMNNATD